MKLKTQNPPFPTEFSNSHYPLFFIERSLHNHSKGFHKNCYCCSIGSVTRRTKKQGDRWATLFRYNTVNLYQLHLNHILDNYRTICDDAYQVGTLLITVHVNISG